MDEQDTCRICSAPAEPGQPLFHPCKCSGTIRYIHQDCLQTWLAHSKKKTCDVCKYPYAFTKVYAPNMPRKLPPWLIARRALKSVVSGAIFCLRALMVATIWLGALPWATVYAWRMYFNLGDVTAHWIADKNRLANSSFIQQAFFSYSGADTVTKLSKKELEAIDLMPWYRRIFLSPAWVDLSSDIFQGQIIASFIVLTFVAIFLLREWIAQNARPGVFEDEEPPPLMEEAPAPAPAPAPPQPAPPLPEDPEPVYGPRLPTLVESRYIEIPPGGLPVQGGTVHATEITDPPLPWPTEGPLARPTEPERNAPTAWGRAQAGPSSSGDSAAPEGEQQNKRRKELPVRDLYQNVHARRQHTAIQAERHARIMGGAASRPVTAEGSIRHRLQYPSSPTSGAFPAGAFETGSSSWENPEASSSSSSAQNLPRLNIPSNTAFTFTAPPDAPRPNLFAPAGPFNNFARQRSPGVTREPEDAYSRPFIAGPNGAQFSFGANSASNSYADNADATGPSSQSSAGPSRFPGSLAGSANGAPSIFGNMQNNTWGNPTSPAAATPPLLTPTRRPPLPPTTTPLRSPGLAPPGSSSASAAAPLDSPSLAMYRAPEELREGYFDDVAAEAESGAEGSESRAGGKGKAAARDETPSPDDWQSINKEMLDQFFPERKGDDADDEDDEEEDGEGHVPGAFGTAEERHRDEEEREEDIIEGELVPEDEHDHADAGGPDDVGARIEVNGGPMEEVEIEGNVDDDVDGALEAIGMRGPIGNVLQNAMLMTFVLDTAIGIGIWVPFTIGKATALLMLNPPQLFKLIQVPMVLIRILTDPIVNGLTHMVVAWALPMVHNLIMFVLRVLLGSKIADKLQSWTTKMYDIACESVERAFSSGAVEETGSVESQASFFWDTVIGKQAEEWLANLGVHVKAFGHEVKNTWIMLAIGDQPAQRAFAVVLGYSVILLGAGIYLNLLSVGNVQTATRAVRNTIRQQLVVLKVAFFIFIEIAVFPLGCGFILDASTMWMFSDVNVAARTEFFRHAPLTATFYHWVAGTMFMYTFAVILAGCRTIMRPGAMWFIKDPQDANAHPIRDILDRSALAHLRKILMSGVMYTLVVCLCVLSLAALLSIGNYAVLPLRWKTREPLSNVPVDLVFLHIALPYTMRYFRPKKAIKASTIKVWKWLSSQLRLSSYFFNETHEEEIAAPASRTAYVAAYLDSLWTGRPLVYNDFVKDRGTWRRVPANDNIPIPAEMRATVEVTEEGLPVDDESRRLMAQQDAEIERSRRKPKDEFIVVYIPPLFRYRIMAFIVSFWTIGSVCAGLAFILPLQLGRLFFRLWIPHDVHDGYSFMAGFYLIWACVHIMRAVDRLDKRRQRTGEEGPRSDLRIYVLKRGSLWLAKITYLAICLGVIIPTLTALVFDCYLILPLRFTFNPTLVPRVRLVDSWATGLLYMKALSFGLRAGPRNSLSRGINQMINSGITHPDPIAATKQVIAPVIGGLLLIILFPAALFKACLLMFPGWRIAGRALFTRFYPGLLSLTLSSLIFEGMHETLQKWQQDIRDSEFLVEMRLRNLEPNSPNTAAAPAS
ncbi:hypothetical protein K525DRAFT_279161 [Schizophyllum commune Loenen D]|nr:hypothetical protein K525DRAFT_279161 [Schizophyllum commune Loenen D]